MLKVCRERAWCRPLEANAPFISYQLPLTTTLQVETVAFGHPGSGSILLLNAIVHLFLAKASLVSP
jgi:hypothetical protein